MHLGPYFISHGTCKYSLWFYVLTQSGRLLRDFFFTFCCLKDGEFGKCSGLAKSYLNDLSYVNSLVPNHKWSDLMFVDSDVPEAAVPISSLVIHEDIWGLI